MAAPDTREAAEVLRLNPRPSRSRREIERNRKARTNVASVFDFMESRGAAAGFATPTLDDNLAPPLFSADSEHQHMSVRKIPDFL